MIWAVLEEYKLLLGILLSYSLVYSVAYIARIKQFGMVESRGRFTEGVAELDSRENY